MKMNISVENDIKIIEMGEKGPNLLSVERAKKLIKELDYSDCKGLKYKISLLSILIKALIADEQTKQTPS